MTPQEFQKKFDVSRETFEKLEIYNALLRKWQKAINLVSGSTLEDAWARHFADSAQLARYIPGHVKTVFDLGSGAGFPGLVLAIMCPGLEVHLIESDERKAQFLKNVSRETLTGIVLHNLRIERMGIGAISVAAGTEESSSQICPPAPGLVTARALADLKTLCGYCAGWAARNPALEMLFLKGARAASEVEEARAEYDFMLEIYPGLTGGEGSILHLRGLKGKTR